MFAFGGIRIRVVRIRSVLAMMGHGRFGIVCLIIVLVRVIRIRILAVIFGHSDVAVSILNVLNQKGDPNEHAKRCCGRCYA